jgi:hypothetical protein
MGARSPPHAALVLVVLQRELSTLSRGGRIALKPLRLQSLVSGLVGNEWRSFQTAFQDRRHPSEPWTDARHRVNIAFQILLALGAPFDLNRCRKRKGAPEVDDV